jgi:hypothetical protein
MKTITNNFDKQLLDPQEWKKVLLSEGYSQIQLWKDPTGMTQKLNAYKKVVNSDPISLFQKLKALTDIGNHAGTLMSTYVSNQKKVALCKYLDQIERTCTKVFATTKRQGYIDILEGRDLKHLQEFRQVTKRELNEGMLDFVLEVAEFQNKVSKGGSQYNDQVSGQDKIMDKYEVRKDDGVLNFPAKERRAWVNAWAETKDWQGVDKSMKCMEKCRQSIWGSLFEESFNRYCLEQK